MRGGARRRRRILWSSEALADLNDIWDYYASVAGPPTADKIVRDIGRACRVLEEHPLAGRARDELRPGIRSIAAHPHVIFYRAPGPVAEIVRVLHGRRDLRRIFDANSGDA